MSDATGEGEMNMIRRVTFVTHCHVEDIPQLEEELQEFWLNNECSLYGFQVASDDPELTPEQWRDAREAILNDEEWTDVLGLAAEVAHG